MLRKISKPKEKKGLSAVVTTVLLVAISVALAGVILGIVKPFAEDQLEESKRCYDVLGSINFNYEYTCYNSSNQTMAVSISQEDVELDGILFVFNDIDGTSSESFTLSNVEGSEYQIPGPESGKMYYFHNVNEKPSYIAIAPIAGKDSCDVSDETYNINTCFQ